jgi:DNA-binding MarR family transcriptional regulator
MAMAEARISRRARTGIGRFSFDVKHLDKQYFDIEILACEDGDMPTQNRTPEPRAAQRKYEAAVQAYVEAGGDESVQRVITAVYGLTRKLDKWYGRQLADLDLSHGEWAVLAYLAKAGDSPVTPSQLADVANVAPSSMTHRLDRMAQRGLVHRAPDPANRTRVLVTLDTAGRDLFTAAVREANVVESDALAGLTTAQRETLASLLEVVIGGLDDLETT